MELVDLLGQNLAGGRLGLLDQPFYLLAFVVQVGFYLIAFAAFSRRGVIRDTLAGRVALYFTSVNMAILIAWVQYFRGVRQELWTPSAR